MSRLTLNKSAHKDLELSSLPHKTTLGRRNHARSENLVEEAYIRTPEPTLYATTTKLSERTKRPPATESSTERHDKKDLNNLSVYPSEASPGVAAHANADQTQTTTLRITKTKLQERNGTIQFISLCWCIYLGGWNDGSTGPLLPRLQEHYNVCVRVEYLVDTVYSLSLQVGYTIVSLIFVGSCFVMLLLKGC